MYAQQARQVRAEALCCVTVLLATHSMACCILDIKEIRETLGCHLML